jgi:hypothetical protein
MAFHLCGKSKNAREARDRRYMIPGAEAFDTLTDYENCSSAFRPQHSRELLWWTETASAEKDFHAVYPNGLDLQQKLASKRILKSTLIEL